MKPEKPTTLADQYAQLQLGKIERRKKFWDAVLEVFLVLLIWAAMYAGVFLLNYTIQHTFDWFARINSDHAKIEQITASNYAVVKDGTPSIMLTSNALATIIENDQMLNVIHMMRNILQQDDCIADLSNRLSALEPKPAIETNWQGCWYDPVTNAQFRCYTPPTNLGWSHIK